MNSSKKRGNLQWSLTKIVDAKRSDLISRLVDNLKEDTPVDTGAARDGWHATADGVSNNVPYIKELNDGSSQQAPAHFVELAILRTKGARITPRRPS